VSGRFPVHILHIWRVLQGHTRGSTLHCGGGAPGGLGHEVLDARTFADWGVSYLKYDNCFAADCKLPNCGNDASSTIARYTAMSNALNRTGKPILFSMCEWGDADPGMWGPAVSNSWRTTADISDVWVYMCELADLTQQWFDRAGP
jgi:alpha-galactosidase